MKTYQEPVVIELRQLLARERAKVARLEAACDRLIERAKRQDQRIFDLLEANNRYLQRAQDAEGRR